MRINRLWLTFGTQRSVIILIRASEPSLTFLEQDPMLWYGIGILYDRYGSYDYAEEAFSQVMQIQPDFEKANEIYFRLGIIYKQQSKFNQSLEVCADACLQTVNTFELTQVAE